MKNSNSLVSVCIPAYNHEKYIINCIKSIINQTYENLELIIIDDESTDSTWEKINSLKDICKSRFKRVVFKKQKNQGTCFTLNKMWRELARGEYVFDIASDDLILPDAIEKLSNFLNSDPDIGLAVGNNLIIDSNDKICYWDKDRNNVYDKKYAKYISFTDFLDKRTKFIKNRYGKYSSLFKENHIANGWMIRKSIIEKIKPFSKLAPLEDIFLHMQISKIAKISRIENDTYMYRWHANNTIQNKKHVDDMLHKTKEYEHKLILNNKLYDNYTGDYKIFRIKYMIKNFIKKYFFEKAKSGNKRMIRLFGIDIFRYNK